MTEPLFNIFRDHIAHQNVKNISRQPLGNSENLGKLASSGPIKPGESVKKVGDFPKKSFLSNTGKAFQSTPGRQPFTPRAVNVASLIYKDKADEHNCKEYSMEALEFTKPSFLLDNYHQDVLDFFPEPNLRMRDVSPTTPPPASRRVSMDLNTSYQDDFFTDDFSTECAFEEDDLPDIFS